jgi:CorA-like Mg2+ transporter protein/ATP dependent DNA ligase domain
MGKILVSASIERRRDLLHRVFAAAKDPLRLSPLLQAPSGQVLEAIRKLGLEGVVGKRVDSTYEAGERSGAWIKLRANLKQEFVIGGYIPGARGFNALLAGVYEKRELIFVAQVWAAIIAAPTAIAGIYGMNFQYMPELGWRYGYEATLVGTAVLLLRVVAGFQAFGVVVKAPLSLLAKQNASIRVGTMSLGFWC